MVCLLWKTLIDPGCVAFLNTCQMRGHEKNVRRTLLELKFRTVEYSPARFLSSALQNQMSAHTEGLQWMQLKYLFTCVVPSPFAQAYSH